MERFSVVLSVLLIAEGNQQSLHYLFLFFDQYIYRLQIAGLTVDGLIADYFFTVKE